MPKTVHHVGLVYYPENVEAAVSTIETMLGIRMTPAPEGLSLGCRGWINYDARLEIVAPIGPVDELGLTGPAAALVTRLYQHLESRGEGLLAIVFDVADDLEDAVSRAESLGATVGARYVMPDDEINGRYGHFVETEVGTVAGVYWWLSDIVPRVPTGRTGRPGSTGPTSRSSGLDHPRDRGVADRVRDTSRTL